MILLDKKLKLLSNVCQSILSNVGGPVTRSHQRKPVHNVKRISVHLSAIYASSVSSSSVRKPVYSSNATKRNVCNASNVCQFIEPLNVSKLVCSYNATERKAATPVVLVNLLSH